MLFSVMAVACWGRSGGRSQASDTFSRSNSSLTVSRSNCQSLCRRDNQEGRTKLSRRVRPGSDVR